MTRTFRVFIFIGLLLAGFVAGQLWTSTAAHAQQRPKVNRAIKPAVEIIRPGIRMQEMQSIHKITTPFQPQQSISMFLGNLPEEPRTLNRVKTLPYLSYVHDETFTGQFVNVVFSNAEYWYFRWLDRVERESRSRLKSTFNDLVTFANSMPDQTLPGSAAAFVLLPPADNEGEADDLRWVIERHENGLVKTVTPYTGNVVRGEGRMHGYRLEYNDDGDLTAMTPYVNGKRHGTAKTFVGTQLSRQQTAKSTTEWYQGRRVVKAAAPKVRTPRKKN